MISDHVLYKHYMNYLDYRQGLKGFSHGAYHLLKISESAFNDFVYDYENHETFKKFINGLHTSESRNEKISDLLNASNRRIDSK